MSFGGLDGSLTYIEYAFDSLDSLQSASANVSSRDWPNFLLHKILNNVAAVKVLEVQIPFTWYVFNQYNNTFELVEVLSPIPITIPVGNYSSTSMCAVLSGLLTAASGLGRTYTVTYSGTSSTAPNTGKFTISCSPANPFYLNFADTEGDRDPSLMLGFNSGLNSSTVGGVLVAPNVALITGPNYIYLNSQALGPLCNIYLPEGADKLGNGVNVSQIAKIPVNVQPNGVIYWQDPGK